jgi:hypothetical protein
MTRSDQGVTITCSHWSLWGVWRQAASALAVAGFVFFIAGSCAVGTVTIRLGPRPEIHGPWASTVGICLIGLSLLFWLAVRVAYANRCRRLTIYAGPEELLIRDEHPDGTEDAHRWPAGEIEAVTASEQSLVVRPRNERWRMIGLPKDPAASRWLTATIREALRVKPSD